MKTIKPKTIKFFTLGCKVNQYDTQSLREGFLSRGFKESEDGKPAAVYVINTCTVTQRADERSLGLIRRSKRENPKAKIIVTGCLTELDEGRIKDEGGVGLIVKNRDKGRILTKKGISFFKGHSRAFLKIQDGCDNFCSYCKVPLVRGPIKSKPIAEIINEADRLVKSGFKEIVLTGICLGAYGRDLAQRPTLVNAIDALEKIDGLLRLRLSSIELSDISDELISRIAKSRRLCKHLHIPLQSGDDRVLKRMNRRYYAKDYLKTILKINKMIPQISITTDVLVGFPGETEESFKNTLKLIKKITPLKVHIFPFSSRVGTAADKFNDPVSPAIIKQRLSRLKKVSEGLSLAYRKRFLNKQEEVLIEGQARKENGYWEGYTGNYIRIWARSKYNLKNKLVTVQLKRIFEDRAIGNIT